MPVLFANANQGANVETAHMSLFRRRTEAEKEVQRVYSRVAKDTKEVYGPPQQLVLAIIQAAQSVREEVSPVFGYGGTRTPSEPEILSFFEFLYFYIHIALRLCVANDYNESQIAAVQNFLGPLTAATAVDSFFLHWPEDRKSGLRAEFLEKLNDAEQEYAACRSTPDDLFGQLARNACALWDRSDDPIALRTVASASAGAYAAVGLEKQVGRVKTVIDRVDTKKLIDVEREVRLELRRRILRQA